MLRVGLDDLVCHDRCALIRATQSTTLPQRNSHAKFKPKFVIAYYAEHKINNAISKFTIRNCFRQKILKNLMAHVQYNAVCVYWHQALSCSL